MANEIDKLVRLPRVGVTLATLDLILHVVKPGQKVYVNFDLPQQAKDILAKHGVEVGRLEL